MDPDRAYRLSIGLTIFFFLVAIVGIIGALLDWWNEVGEVIITVGTLAGTIGAFVSIGIGSSRDQVQTVHAAVHAKGSTLGSMDGKLDSVDGKLESVDTKLDKLEDLDTIQAELDHQTGVLDTQVSRLTQIRDRL